MKTKFFRKTLTMPLMAVYLMAFAASCVLLASCYSFTGASVPDHIKTIYITPVGDNSGNGNPKYSQSLSLLLTEKFERENALTVGDATSNAKLMVTIVSIKDETISVKPGELESQRKVTVTCSAEYYDAVKKKQFWNKSFTQFDVYDIANMKTGLDAAVDNSIKQIADDIVLAVVSGW